MITINKNTKKNPYIPIDQCKSIMIIMNSCIGKIKLAML